MMRKDQLNRPKCPAYFYLALILCVSHLALAGTNLVLLGAPGSGKGTLAEKLEQALNLPRISTGDIVRAQISAGTPFGKAIAAIANSGGLVADGTPLMAEMVALLAQRLQQSDCKNGFILDGFPRSAQQALDLDQILGHMGEHVSHAILLQVSDQLLIDRITGRQVCKKCQLSYHKIFAKPKVADTCDRCCQQLTQRSDDTPAIANHRLDLYKKEIQPIAEHYIKQNKLHSVDGEGSPDTVLNETLSRLKTKP